MGGNGALTLMPAPLPCRVCSRGWEADPYLKEVAQSVVIKKGSIVRLIQNSELFKSWWQEFNLRLERYPVCGKRIKDLNFAKHRFNSTQRPFGRSVIFFDSLISTAMKITRIRARTSAESLHAQSFLDFLDSERALTLAMLADAGDETDVLVRLLDSERVDPSMFCDAHRWVSGSNSRPLHL